jgi:hypothetical protein
LEWLNISTDDEEDGPVGAAGLKSGRYTREERKSSNPKPFFRNVEERVTTVPFQEYRQGKSNY